MNNELILIVEDEAAISRLLTIALESEGYRVVHATRGKEALGLAASRFPAMILLDLGLPDMDGIEVLNSLREWYARPVMILSVRNSQEDIVTALDNGANDYMTKPFRVWELAARIRASIRRNLPQEVSQAVEIGSLVIDIPNRTVKKDGSLLKLTSTEFTMLSMFVQKQGCVLTHQQIIKEVWGSYGYQDQSCNLRVFVSQLRKKIEEDPARPSLLITESGIGYRFGS